MKQIIILLLLIISCKVLVAQSPVTIPYPEMQFYSVPVSKEIVDNKLDSICEYWYSSWFNTIGYSWRKVFKYEFQYNETGLLTKSIKWNWRYDENYWKGESMFEYNYLNNKLTKSIEYLWWNDSTNWVKRYVNEYEYNQNTITEIKYYNYIKTSELQKTSKRISYYNENWKIKEETNYDWIAFDGSFSPLSKLTYAYDTKNRLTEFIDYSHIGIWVYDFKHTYVFNDDSCTMEHVELDWQNYNWVEYWRSTQKYTYKNNQPERIVEYDPNLHIIYWYDFKYVDDKLFERGNSNEKINCYYSDKLANTNQIQVDKSQNVIYPNPATNEIHFQQVGVKRIDLYSVNAVLVYSKDCNSLAENQIINISDIDKGLYILQIVKENGQITNQKLVKK
jgi:hypothetical protein